ncbi:MAG: FtsX-like permease family protein, partial [Anaerolineae bacterium]
MVLAGDVIGGAIASYGEQVENQQSTAGILGGQLEQWLGVVGLVLLGMAAFVVFNAFLMSVTQRRRQIGVLRSLGLTRQQVTRLLLGEALWVGTAGTVAGLVLGPLAGWGLVRLLSELAEIEPGGTMPSADSALLAILVGMGTTVLAALLPARRAMRIPPLEAVREGTPPGRTTSRAMPWLLAGLALVVMLGAYLAVAPPATHIPTAEGDGISWHLVLTIAISLIWLVALGLILPALVASLGHLVRTPLSRLWGAVGRLVADNLGRARGRVTLTVVTLALSVALIVGITGSLTMFSQSLLYYYTSQEVPPRWALFSIGWSGDLVSWQTVSEIDLSQMGISDELHGEVRETFGDQAEILAVHAAILPELDVIPGSMSFLFDPPTAQRMGVFDFYEGDWDHAVPIMEQECGILIAPALARRHGVWLYDRLTVPGKDGPVECTVAGLGQSANFGATIVGEGAADRFAVPDKPMGLFVQPDNGVDVDAFAERLRTFSGAHDRLYLMDLAEVDDFQETMVRGMLAILNGPLLLAIAAAALGVVNTTAMSVSERQQELGLLRAVGATRRQVRPHGSRSAVSLARSVRSAGLGHRLRWHGRSACASSPNSS